MPEATTPIQKPAAGVWKMHLLILTTGIILVAIVGYGFYSGNRMVTVDASLLQSAMKLKIETSTTNLFIEGLLSEGPAGDFQPVWEPVEAALHDFIVLVKQSRKRGILLPFRPAAIEASDLEVLTSKFSLFKETASQRFAEMRVPFIEKEADRHYRLAFRDLSGYLDSLEERLRRAMDANLLHFRNVHGILIFLCALLTALTALLFLRFAKQQRSSYGALSAANNRLEIEIAERQRAAEAVRASEERFRQLAENIMDVFWLEDLGEPPHFVYVSPTFTQWSDRDLRDVYADNRLFWEIVHPHDRQTVMETYHNFTAEAGNFDATFRIILPDGSVRWVRSRGFPIRNAHGRMHRAAGLAQDVTEQKRQEERREQLVKELKDFSNAVSHDLRAPLINLKGFSKEIEAALELIRPAIERALRTDGENGRPTATAFYESLPEAVDFINASVSKMERLIDAILRLSRLERRELFPERLDMNAVVEDTLKSLGHQIKTLGIRLTVSDLPAAIGDRVSMEQIFSNLIGNAINYLEPMRPGEIEIGAETRLDENIYFVRDNGRGIRKTDLDRVFNLFERLDADSVAGEGMGLAYVRALVRRHGGEVQCASEFGVGTKFTFSITKRIN